jgi:hypothetical protein
MSELSVGERPIVSHITSRHSKDTSPEWFEWLRFVPESVDLENLEF